MGGPSGADLNRSAFQGGIMAAQLVPGPRTGTTGGAAAAREVEHEGAAQTTGMKAGGAKGATAKTGAAKAAAEAEREALTTKATGLKGSGAKMAASGANKAALTAKGGGAAKIAAAGATGKAMIGVGGAGAAAAAAGGSVTGSPAIAAGGSAMLTSKGMSLGLGLGLGAWGPVLAGLVGLAGIVGLYGYCKKRRAEAKETDAGDEGGTTPSPVATEPPRGPGPGASPAKATPKSWERMTFVGSFRSYTGWR